MAASQSSSQRNAVEPEIFAGAGPDSRSRGSSESLKLDLTRSSIRSHDLRQSQQPESLPRNREVSISCSTPSGIHNSNRMLPPKSDIDVGTLMHPESGAWANRSSDFSLPVKPLGLQKNQAPLLTSPQEAFRKSLRMNRFRNLRKTQALVMGVHDIPFTCVPAIAAQPSIQSPKGRKRFPQMYEQISVRDCLSTNGRSPIPTINPSTRVGDRPCPAAASFLFPEGYHPCETVDDLTQDETKSLDSSRRRHTPNKKDRNFAGGSISVDLNMALKFLS